MELLNSLLHNSNRELFVSVSDSTGGTAQHSPAQFKSLAICECFRFTGGTAQHSPAQQFKSWAICERFLKVDENLLHAVTKLSVGILVLAQCWP